VNLFRRLFFDIQYFRRPPWDSGISPPELLAFLEDRHPARVIDLGCGTGTNVVTLASRGWKVTGVDFSPRAITKARKRVEQAGVNADFSVGDVTHLDGITGPFEVALDIGCFHSLSENGKLGYIRQLMRILAPRGYWFLYAFLTEHLPPGLFPSDLETIADHFTMVSYKDGVDKRQRPSAYFIFQKH
jgi:SAM-dependent methyltransferase